MAIEIDVPDDIAVTTWTAPQLPRSWRRYPAPPRLQRLGDAWLDGEGGALLCVPSTIVPSERNYLINPLHPDTSRLTIIAKTSFRFDPRLLVKGKRRV